MAGTAWNAGLRPASRGSAKPGRMTRRQANVSAAPCSCPVGCAEDPIMDVSPGGSRHGPQGHQRFLAVRPYWASVRGSQRCERCLPLPGTDHAERRNSRREGTTSEWGSFPSPAFGGLCRPEAGVPSRPRRRGGRRSAFPGGRRHHAGWRSQNASSPGGGAKRSGSAGMDRRPSPRRENWAAWVSPQAVRRQPSRSAPWGRDDRRRRPCWLARPTAGDTMRCSRARENTGNAATEPGRSREAVAATG